MDKNFLIQNIFIGFVVFLVGLTIWGGFSSGKALARSKLIVANAKAISMGLDYFYADYDRFPSLLEYGTQNLMTTYFSKWPPVEFSSKLCGGSYGYESINYNQYILSVCLPKNIDGAAKGINQFTVTK
jgi:hypothetical protein